MVNTMFKIKFMILGAATLLCSVNASSQSLDAGYGQFGAMVYWQGELPPADGAQIVRTSEGNNEEMRWTIRTAQTPEEVRHNLNRKPPVFKDLFSFTEQTTTLFLDRLVGAPSVERIPYYQFPSVLYALGLAVWDTTVVHGETYRYRIMIDGAAVDDGVLLRTELSTDFDWLPTFTSASYDRLDIQSRWHIPYEKRAEVITFLGYRSPAPQPDFRTVDGIREFTVVNDSLFAVFTDTTNTEMGVYYYIIRPVNRYGELGPISEYAQGASFPSIQNRCWSLSRLPV